MGKVKMIGPIPQIGFGTWNHFGDEAYDGVISALEVGYRHIDTAEGYKNEEFVGKAIAESGVARNDIFLTTKVAPESFAPGQIMEHVKVSLDKLRTDKVDLLLLHYPSIGDEYDIEDYMAQFAAVYDAGLTANIGVSNFTKKYIDKALELLGDRRIVTNQCEAHVLMQNRIIVDHCASKGIPTTAYSPLARGALADNETLLTIGNNHGVTREQVALAFLMAEGHVIIPSSANPGHIASNFAAKDVTLTDAEIEIIRGLDANHRLVNGSWCPTWDV
ncbi:MAG: aldo/keto reductase [Rhodobacteraceae bacterium]|nr:aldo/keto reductase [Paracoccaceae bacterium]